MSTGHGVRKPDKTKQAAAYFMLPKNLVQSERRLNSKCKGCMYWGGTGTCDYILVTGHPRGVPIKVGGGCTKKKNGPKRRWRVFDGL